MSAPLQVLIVDDEVNIRRTLRVCLESLGHAVTEAASAASALEAVEATPCELAFVDMRLGQDDGLDLIPALLSRRPHLAIVIITAYATVASAVSALQRGAADYLPKPFTPAQIRHLIERLRAQARLEARVSDLQRRLEESIPSVLLSTASPAMRETLDVLARAAEADVSILLRGESGTGKGVLARFVHEHSARRDKPFVTINCPTLSGELLTSELFGHARGAFTGAVRDQPGKVEAADGGTLFLDEVAEIAPPLQAKLLRFLHEHAFERVGETRTRHADVRVLAATHRDLEHDVTAGAFRLDLLYRLNVVEVVVPPLRQRPPDVLPLAEHFLAFFARTAGRPPPSLSPAVRSALQGYPWPGNVRELRNEMERALVLARSASLEPGDFSARIRVSSPAGGEEVAPGADVTLDALEREHIRRILQSAASLDDAARILGIDPSTLWRKRRRYGLG